MDCRRENILSPSEIVTEILVPIPKAGSKGFHHKLRERLAWDHATVAVDTVVESSSGVVRHASVIMGGRGADSLGARSRRKNLCVVNG